MRPTHEQPQGLLAMRKENISFHPFPNSLPCVSAKSSIPWRSWYVLILVTSNGTHKAQVETVGKHIPGSLAQCTNYTVNPKQFFSACNTGFLVLPIRD